MPSNKELEAIVTEKDLKIEELEQTVQSLTEQLANRPTISISRRRTGIEVQGVVLADNQNKAHAMHKLASRSKANLEKVIPLRLEVMGFTGAKWRFVEAAGQTPRVEIQSGESFEIHAGAGDSTDYYLVPTEAQAASFIMPTAELPENLGQELAEVAA